jgi:hypothetical protein
MTPTDVIAEVRILINDVRIPQRYSDTDLLSFVNNTVRRMAMLRPDIFTVTAQVATTPDVTQQQLPTTATRLIDILYVVGAGAVEEVDRAFFDTATISWVTDASGTPTKFMRNPKEFRGYFLYPRPSSGVQLMVQYSAAPSVYQLADQLTPIPVSYFSALVDGVVYLASSVDDEHVSSGRAELFNRNFIQTLQASFEADKYIDTPPLPASASLETRIRALELGRVR